MKTVWLSLMGALACSAFTLPAQAQLENPTGSRIGRPKAAIPSGNARLSNEDQALRTTFDLMRCVIQYEEQEFRSSLNLWKRKFTEKQVKIITGKECLLNASLRMPTQLLRGAMFRTFYIKDFDQSPITNLADPVDYIAMFNQFLPLEKTDGAMLDFASCVVRTDPVNSRAFVIGIPGEQPFESALKALVPQLGSCMYEGMEVQISKSMLATYLSEALYWETKAAKEAQGA